MTGYKGKIGAIVIVLALVVSVFAGFATNVDKTTNTTTQYDYVTDVSGLFNYEKTPVYVDYDVNKNYIGYQEYTSNTTYTKTDTYDNTAVSGEVWKTSTAFTGTIPYNSEYVLYVGTDSIHINGSTVTYNQTTYTDVTSVVINSSNITINTQTPVVISCDPSTILYQYISGYDVLGGTSLYKVAEGSTFYFNTVSSGNDVCRAYRVNTDHTLTEIQSTDAGITQTPARYTYQGTVSGTILVSNLSFNSIVATSTEYTNSYTSMYQGSFKSSNATLTASQLNAVIGSGQSITSYTTNGKLVLTNNGNGTLSLYYYDDTGDLYDSMVNKTSLYWSSNRFSSGSESISSFSGNVITDTQLFAQKFMTNTYECNCITPNTTYYYNIEVSKYYFDTKLHTIQTDQPLPDTTTLPNSAGRTGNSGTSSLIFIRESNPITIQSGVSTTFTNTQDAVQTVYSYGITPTKTFTTSAYDLYSGQYHVTWNDKTVTVIDNGTSDTVTLTTPMTINNNALTITGQSVRYSDAHTYTVSLTAPYVFKNNGQSDILTGGTTVYRVSGTAYYKSSSTIFGYLNNTMTTTVGGTLYEHGVYTKTVGTSYIWTDSVSVTSDQYTAYDMTALTPTASKGITYTTTTQPNAYVVGSINSSGTGNKSLKDNTYIQVTIPEYTYFLATVTTYQGDNTTGYMFYKIDSGVTLQNYVASLNLPSTTTNITLSYESRSGTSNNNIVFGSTNIIDSTQYDTDTYFKKIIDGYQNNVRYVTSTGSHNTSGTIIDQTNPPAIYTIQYDITTNKIKSLSWYGDVNLNGSDYAFYYNTSTYITEDYLIHSVVLDNNGGYVSSGYSHSTPTQTSNINYAYAYTTPTYMDVRDGIKISATNDHSITRWSNGYDNGQISIVLHVGNASETATNTLKLSTGDKITVTHGTNAMTAVTINDGASYNVGVWSNYLLTINAQTGIVTMTPIDIFGNFNQIVLIDYVATVGTIGTNQVITYIDWSYTASSWGLSVYQTKVNLNTYGAVMRNPSINIGQYFPDIEDARLNLYSFALYGDTMTVNGVTYYGGSGTQSIKETGNVYIQNKSYKLQNIYITYTDGKTYLTFVDDNKTIDLGTTTNGTLSFGGFWYYTTGLYEGHETTETTYNWNVSQFGFSMSGLALLALGLTLVGVIVARRFMSEEMTAIDYVLIVGAIMFYLALIGGIML